MGAIAVIEQMGALQSGMPSPTMLSADWPLFIIDLKDCLFSILLYPHDKQKFALTVPALNTEISMEDSFPGHGTLASHLPVARSLSRVRKQFPVA